MRDVVIVSAARTPIGGFDGALKSIPATKLGSLVVAEAVKRAGLEPGQVDEVIMGNVLSAGLGQAPARQAALGAGLPASVEALTINKVCGSGLMAVVLAARAIAVGDAEVAVAGGMESMSRAPYLLNQARDGYRMGHAKLIDAMLHDGLWDPYHDFHMGMCGELCAARYQISRDAQDDYAIESYQRALKAQMEGKFNAEIVPVEVNSNKGEPTLFMEDGGPKRFDRERLKRLQPAFKPNGTITPGNAPSVNDGAAALTVMSLERAKALDLTPMARIVGYATAALAPEWFPIAPAEAIRKVMKKTGLDLNDIDLFEINEAFALVALAAIHHLGLDGERVNIHGGAVALGHPIGASGARILTTLLYAMRDREAERGLAVICLGGGEAVAMVVEQP
ncbi:MAG: acetyl-CoA C-acetyltransferase, partial [Candidatus Methylomirabilis oxyfera]|nr:acetyl-CoA C-acetyltransferase [Candidatus Methylomirabilis oxyfera]